jgi:excisionase family DNA binding protein
VIGDILSVEQAAELLQLTSPTVRQMASRGIIPGRRYGKLWRFSLKQLIAHVEAGDPCPSTNAEAPRTTGVDSHSAVSAFNNLREQPREKPQKSMRRPFGVVPGGKQN